jgi:hypothetical protein
MARPRHLDARARDQVTWSAATTSACLPLSAPAVRIRRRARRDDVHRPPPRLTARVGQQAYSASGRAGRYDATMARDLAQHGIRAPSPGPVLPRRRWICCLKPCSRYCVHPCFRCAWPAGRVCSSWPRNIVNGHLNGAPFCSDRRVAHGCPLNTYSFFSLLFPFQTPRRFFRFHPESTTLKTTTITTSSPILAVTAGTASAWL